jgi:pSer/pThr/pTyr-binding forkhead associated (FHA) protein
VPSFTVQYPDGQSEQFPIDQDLLMIGRSPDAHLRLHDAQVSRVHCELRQSADGTWLISDMGSRNGTVVNGQPVQQARLNDNDQLQLGSVLLTFHQN